MTAGLGIEENGGHIEHRLRFIMILHVFTCCFKFAHNLRPISFIFLNIPEGYSVKTFN